MLNLVGAANIGSGYWVPIINAYGEGRPKNPKFGMVTPLACAIQKMLIF